MAVVAGMVGIYVTSAVGALGVLAGGLIMVWITQTLLKRAAESEARLHGMLDTTMEAIITIDSAGLIESFNTGAEAMFGYSSAEVLGHNLTLLMPSSYREAHEQGLRRYLATGVRQMLDGPREVEGQRKDGSRFPVELTVSEVRQGNRRTFSGIVRDISPRKAVEEHRQRLIDQLMAASKELETMMTTQVTSTNQVVTTAQQIAATAQELVQTMQGVTGMAADTATAAEGGQSGLARMQVTMQTMEGATRTIAD